MSAISTQNPQPGPEREPVKFRLSYIGLPLVLLAIAVILAAIFYSRLPDPMAYRFQTSAADRLINRNIMLAWLILPNVLCVVMSWGLVRLVLATSVYWEDEGSFIARVLPLMGNMPTVAQIIFVLAGLQIYIYNTAGKLVAPFWPVAAGVLLIGAAIMFFKITSLFLESRRRRPKPDQE